MDTKLLIKVTILVILLSICFSILMFILPLIPFIIIGYLCFVNDDDETPLDENLGAFFIEDNHVK